MKYIMLYRIKCLSNISVYYVLAELANKLTG